MKNLKQKIYKKGKKVEYVFNKESDSEKEKSSKKTKSTEEEVSGKSKTSGQK